MKKQTIIWSVACVFSVLQILFSCTNNNISHLQGRWEGNILSPPVEGKETIRLHGDSIIVTDTLYYSARGNKLEAGMRATIFNRGIWRVDHDSIRATFDGAIVSLDTASFVLKNIVGSDSVIPVTNDVMYDEFRTAIGEELKELYHEGVEYTVTLGKIVMPDSNSLLIEKGKYRMAYIRK